MSGSQSYIAAMIGTIAFVFMVMVAIRWPRKVFSALLGIFALMFVFALMLPAFHTTSRTRVRSVQRFDFDDELNHPTIRLDKSDGQDRVHRGHQDQTELQLIIQNRGDQVVIESSHAANSHLTSMSHHHDEFSEKSKEDESCEKCEADDGKQVCCDDDDDAIECDDDGDAKTTVVAVASTAPVAPNAPAVPTVASADKITKRFIDDPFAPETEDLWESDEPQDTTAEMDQSGTVENSAADDVTEAKENIVTLSKPDWIYDTLSTSHEPHQMTIRCGPFQTRDEVNRRLDGELQAGAQKYAEWYLNAHGKRTRNFGGSLRMRMPIERLHECVVDTFDDVHVSDVPGVGKMPVRYVLMEFDSDFRNKVIDAFWRQSVSVGRAVQAGLAASGVFSLLGVVFGAIRFDSWSRGKHRKKVAASAGLLVTVALLTLTAGGLYFLQH